MKEEELRTVFEKVLDRDGNGFVTPEEFKLTIAEGKLSFPVAEGEIDEFIKKADVNGDGQLSFEGNYAIFFSWIRVKMTIFVPFLSFFASVGNVIWNEKFHSLKSSDFWSISNTI